MTTSADSLEHAAPRRAAWWRYVLDRTAVSFGGALLVGVICVLLYDADIGAGRRVPAGMGLLAESLLAVFVAPPLENLAMIAVIEAMLWLKAGRLLAAGAGALALALVHAAYSPWAVALAAWPFTVLAATYLDVRFRGRRQGYLLTCLVHGLHNALGMLTVALLSLVP